MQSTDRISGAVTELYRQRQIIDNAIEALKPFSEMNDTLREPVKAADLVTSAPSKLQNSYWTSLTPKQRSIEMKRRRLLGKRSRKQRNNQ